MRRRGPWFGANKILSGSGGHSGLQDARVGEAVANGGTIGPRESGRMEYEGPE